MRCPLHWPPVKSPILALLLVTAAGLGFARAEENAPRFAGADTSGFDFRQFGLLAIQEGGRRKPVDTFAKEALIRLSGRSSYTDKSGRRWEGRDFLLSAMLETHDWKNEPLILVSLGKLIEQAGLDKNRRRFSFAELSTRPELERLANVARAKRKAEQSLERVEQEANSVEERLSLLARIMDGSAFTVVPASSAGAAWASPTEFSRYYTEEQFAPAQHELQNTATAYAKGDGFAFATASRQLRDALRTLNSSIYPSEKQLRLESTYNHFEAFYRAVWFYGFGFLALVIAHLRGRGRILRAIGVALAVIGLALHASGIVMRCLIAGRPPVTNMYESIIWVSFAVSFFGMIFFLRYRTSIYLLAALPVTLIALLLVHQMPIAMPASIDPLVPVLRDNFWLTIHVLTITLSYAAFALAMGFGHILLWRYAREPSEARSDASMHFWLYRILQLGVLLLAAGTILGGVWANYSWGRFWGWDPKETWALIALLCYITTLHGRLAGWWTQFGLVVASVVCFLAVLMAWYGVNFVLGKGLHSYGFGIGGETYVATFVALDLAFVAFAVSRYRTSRA